MLNTQEAYLYTAALAELKTGSQVKSRNDGVALKSMTAVLQREADAISQKLNEDMQRLHSDIQVRLKQRLELDRTDRSLWFDSST